MGTRRWWWGRCLAESAPPRDSLRLLLSTSSLLTVFLRVHAALREPPMRLCARCPDLRRPRLLRPADVRPRISRCLWTGSTIQLMRGSRRMALCEGSTRMTS
jgi:hypothetical protein